MHQSKRRPREPARRWSVEDAQERFKTLQTCVKHERSLSLRDGCNTASRSAQSTAVGGSSSRSFPSEDFAFVATGHNTVGGSSRGEDIRDLVASWMILSNGTQDAELRHEFFQKMIQRALNNLSQQIELFKQLCRRVDGASDLTGKRNTWSLLDRVLGTITCPEACYDFVMAHAKSVAFKEKQDPLVRQLALKVLYTLLELPWANEVCATSLRSKMSALVPSSHHVHFLDGSEIEMVYDSNTTIGDGIEQVAHTLGLKNWERFAIHESKEGNDVMVNNRSLVTDALSTEYCIERDDKKLVMKLVVLDFEEADISDPHLVHLAYIQSQISYGQAPCSANDEDAVYLCALQFCIEHGTQHIEEASLAVVANAAHKYIPKKIREKRDLHCWMEDLMAASRKIRPTLSKEQLQMLFLEYCGRLPFGNCAVIKAESEFVSSVRGPTASKLFLAININGIHFFERGSSRYLKSVRIKDIQTEDCKFDKHTLRLSVQKSEKPHSYLLRTDQSMNVEQALKLYALKEEQTDSVKNKTRTSKISIDRTVRLGNTVGTHSTIRWTSDDSSGSESYSDTESDSSSVEQTELGPTVDRNALAEDMPLVSDVGLETIKQNSLFADRYWVEGRVNDNPGMLSASHVHTGQGVILKFYHSRTQFESSKECHERVYHSDYVCTLIDVVENEPGFPPCLVLLKGCITLEEWLESSRRSETEKKAVIDQLVNALVEIHDEGVVYCNLAPSNVMRFSDDKWKLVGFDHATIVGQPTSTCTALRYTSPEILQAAEQGMKQATLDSGTDMFSFAVIAYEIFTGRSFYEKCLTDDDVKDCLCAENPMPSLENVSDPQLRELLENLLCLISSDRWTARKAAQNSFFKPTGSIVLQESRSTEAMFETMQEILSECRSVKERLRCSDLIVSVNVECFTKSSDEADPFHVREGEEAYTVSESELPDDPVFLMRAQEKHRLRISMLHKNSGPTMITAVNSVAISTPDGKVVEAEIAQETVNDRRHELAILLDPAEFLSPLFMEPSPQRGELLKRCLALDIFISVQMQGNARPRELHHRVYCRMVARENTFRARRFRRRLRSEWNRLPRWVRDTSRASLSFFRLAVVAGI